ncbi:MAG: hypothetical protein H0U74_13545 [Bradymonadaceae bacterium]|nr:hypothetical protein [Lujinxingiaceae bacterium]
MSGLTACEPTDDEPVLADEDAGQDVGDDDTQEFCRASTPVQCGDGSCVSTAARCPDFVSIEGTLDAAVSPGVISAQSPETVTLRLRVNAPDELDARLAAGASLVVELALSDEVLTIDAQVVGRDGDAHLLSFSPAARANRGPERAALSVSLRSGAVEIARFGRASLRFRGDPESLQFDGKAGGRLEGIVDARQAWAIDLDDDGVEDRVVFDGGSTLHVFRCEHDDLDRCEPAGKIDVAALDGRIFVPDYLFAPNHQDESKAPGFVYATITKRDAEGQPQVVEVGQVELGLADMQAHQVKIDLRLDLEVGERLLEDTIMPRQFIDHRIKEITLGLSVMSTNSADRFTKWTTKLIDSDGKAFSYSSPLNGLNLDPVRAPPTMTPCLTTSALQTKSDAADSMVVATFWRPGQVGPTLAIGPLASSELAMKEYPIAPTDRDRNDDVAIACRFKDLDGDGIGDLAIAVGNGRSGSLYLARGLSTSGGEALAKIGPLQLLIEDVDVHDWQIFAQDQRVYLHTNTQSAAMLGPDLCPQCPREDAQRLDFPLLATLTITADSADSFGIALVHQGGGLVRGTALVNFNIPDAPGSIPQGNDKVVRKKPGPRTPGFAPPNGGFETERHVFATKQLVTDDGIWLATSVAGSIEQADSGRPVALSISPGETRVGLVTTLKPFQQVVAPASLGFDARTELIHSSCPFIGDCSAQSADARPLIYALSIDDGRLRADRLSVVNDLPVIKNEAFIEILSEQANEIVGLHTTALPAGRWGAGAESTLLVFTMGSGELFTAVLEHGTTEPVTLTKALLQKTLFEALGLVEAQGLQSAIWVGDLGAGPVVALRGRHGVGEAVVLFDGTSYKTLTTGLEERFAFADTRGLGHAQLLRITNVAQCSQGASVTIASAFMHPDDGADDPWQHLEASLESASEPVCLPKGRLHVVDLDGDGCDDLVADGRLLSSRCDGDFQLTEDTLARWIDHLDGDDGWDEGPQRGVGYNSSRSNKCNSIAFDINTDIDAEGDGDTAPGLPFFDGVLMLRW